MPITTVDFETEAIVAAPAWKAPRPVGVSILVEGCEPRYYAWGHPSENNCTQEEAVKALSKVWDGELLFHNAAFDLSVAEQHLGLPWPADPIRVHDTMYLLFLADPYAKTTALKPSAERYLGLPPEERDEVKEWVMAHIPGATVKQWGASIALAPGALVGRYANGDTVRTRGLYDHLRPTTPDEPYQREQRLMPLLAASTKTGIDLDVTKLDEDAGMFEIALTRSTHMIYKLLNCEFNVDSDASLIEALVAADAVEEWNFTEKGNRSVARKALRLKPEFLPLMELLSYRGMLSTCLSSFVRPWLGFADEHGKLHPQWNSTRGQRTAAEPNGTRTGRLSSNEPNFMAVPNGSDLKVPRGLPPLPQMRKYVKPPEGHIWIKRDFSAQEMRIMAHFAEGKLYDAYQKDPNVDPHQMVKELIYELLAIDLPRKNVKITGFGIMYGMGVAKLADGLDIPFADAGMTRNAYYTALPEVKKLSAACRQRGSAGLAIRTWGGRTYFREPHPDRDLSYKLLNYLIQGSAADQTKQSIIDWHDAKHVDDVFLASVHDELNVSAPIEDLAPAMFRLRTAMDKPRFSVPFRSEGFAGPNWQDIKPYEA